MSSSNLRPAESEEASQDLASDPFSVALTIALAAIGRRSLSKKEVATHLRKRSTPDSVIPLVLQRLEEMGYINDLEFARAFSDRSRRVKKSSRRALTLALREKGIDQEIIDWVVEDIPAESDRALAQEFARKKWRVKPGEEIDAARRRVAAALMRRGFSADLIREVLKEVAI